MGTLMGTHGGTIMWILLSGRAETRHAILRTSNIGMCHLALAQKLGIVDMDRMRQSLYGGTGMKMRN
jgi:hypothetical protein